MLRNSTRLHFCCWHCNIHAPTLAFEYFIIVFVLQAAGDLCLHKLGANLYERIKKECEIHIAEKISALVGQSPDLVVFLSLIQRTWQDFCDQMLIIRGIALLLDVKYVKNVANICSVWDMGLQLFRKHLSLSPEIEHKTVTGLLRLIESERYACSSVITSVSDMCTSLSILLPFVNLSCD